MVDSPDVRHETTDLKVSTEKGLGSFMTRSVARCPQWRGGTAMLDRIARARARALAQVRALVEGTPAGFPWLAIAGKTLVGWVVIDMEATLVTARWDKEDYLKVLSLIAAPA